MDLLSGITHIHHASFKIEREKMNIYIDPFELKVFRKDADYIFCTHTHYDHLSISDIECIINKNTILIVPKSAEEEVKNLSVKKIIYVEPDFNYKDENISFSTVSAYNLNKKFHLKKNKWVGYIINIKGNRYYFAGDTDFIPEMKEVVTDVAFLPVGGTYTMNALEAVEAANLINPKIAVPMHFSHLIGCQDDANYFIKNINKNIDGRILI